MRAHLWLLPLSFPIASYAQSAPMAQGDFANGNRDRANQDLNEANNQGVSAPTPSIEAPSEPYDPKTRMRERTRIKKEDFNEVRYDVVRRMLGPQVWAAPGMYFLEDGTPRFTLLGAFSYGFDVAPLVMAPGFSTIVRFPRDAVTGTGLLTLRIALPIGIVYPFYEIGIGPTFATASLGLPASATLANTLGTYVYVLPGFGLGVRATYTHYLAWEEGNWGVSPVFDLWW